MKIKQDSGSYNRVLVIPDKAIGKDILNCPDDSDSTADEGETDSNEDASSSSSHQLDDDESQTSDDDNNETRHNVSGASDEEIDNSGKASILPVIDCLQSLAVGDGISPQKWNADAQRIMSIKSKQGRLSLSSNSASNGSHVRIIRNIIVVLMMLMVGSGIFYAVYDKIQDVIKAQSDIPYEKELKDSAYVQQPKPLIATSEEKDLMAEFGCDSESMTSLVIGFASAFFNMNAESYENGNWKESILPYVNEEEAMTSLNANLIRDMLSDDFQQTLIDYPYYVIKLKSIDDIEWNATASSEGRILTCRATVTVQRPSELLYDSSENEGFHAHVYQDTYELKFDDDHPSEIWFACRTKTTLSDKVIAGF